jgi:hypothetical protein
MSGWDEGKKEQMREQVGVRSTVLYMECNLSKGAERTDAGPDEHDDHRVNWMETEMSTSIIYHSWKMTPTAAPPRGRIT